MVQVIVSYMLFLDIRQFENTSPALRFSKHMGDFSNSIIVVGETNKQTGNKH
jgi:hypothetical protein